MRYFLMGLLITQIWAQERLLLHVADLAGPFSTHVILVNTTEDPAAYRFTAYRKDGSEIGVTQAALAGGQTLNQEAGSFFESDAVSHFTVTSDAGLKVLLSYEAKSGGSAAQSAEQQEQAKRWQFFPGDPQSVHDGLAVVNLGAQPTDVVFRHFRKDGTLVSQQVLFAGLAPMAKGIHLVASQPEALHDGDLFQVEANQAIGFLGLRFNRDGSNFLWENPAVALPPSAQGESGGVRNFKLLFTNDEHGWMEPTDTHGGAAGMVGLWKANEGPRENLLILSGGDMWTGPAISTWTQGASMAAVLDAMDYDAAAVGNHEFDFGLDILRQRASASAFPFISANMREKQGGRRVDYALPFAVVKAGGVNVGVIGLTTVFTPNITFPSITGDIDFLAYEEALRQTVPLTRAHGAEALVVSAHTCTINLRPLAPVAAELGISLLAGGHCNHLRVEEVNGVTLLEAGSFLRYYGRVGFSIESGQVTITSASLVENQGGQPDPQVQAVVDHWKGEVDDELNQVIGYLSTDLNRNDPALQNMVYDAWLWAFPDSEIAIGNRGGIRQGLMAGEITRGDIVGVLPFENLLTEVRITGQQIIDNIQCCRALLGGMSAVGGFRLANGDALNPSQIYRTMTTDFLYQGGGGFLFATQDPNPFETGLNWRQPVIDWILSLKTSADKPLDGFLDTTPPPLSNMIKKTIYTDIFTVFSQGP